MSLHSYDTAIQLLFALPFLGLVALSFSAGCDDPKRKRHLRIWFMALINLLVALSWIREWESALRPGGLFIQVFVSGTLGLAFYQGIILFCPRRLK